ncbi:SDR family NAD(P)-dependent oxidoreductase [Burkholderia gladioli]|uniref:SDR family NAD(P)-dependent oxidoreductase n=1 Tax=Burkholderia gladioli TaxID=28095 RepID=UPI001C251053|nr:SDR family NAD(P)-dependent oxidoreductase [Burkholderia gladioli]MBU9213785.1 SDR family NAD(P)-dependent oxidoreductase [Burkholderia gladioli]
MSTEHTLIAELLDQWISGQSPDWDRLYPDGRPPLESAPGYPFARNVYWVRETAAASAAPAGGAMPAAPAGQAAAHDATPISRDAAPGRPSRGMPITLGAAVDAARGRFAPRRERVPVTLSALNALAVPPAPAAASAPPAAPVSTAGQAALPARGELEAALIESLARILSMSSQGLGARDRFDELGVDSLIGQTWLRELNRTYASDVDGAVLARCGHVEALAAYLVGSEGASSPARDLAPARRESVAVASIAPAAPEIAARPAMTPAAAVATAPAPVVTAAAPAASRPTRDALVRSLAASLAKALYMDAAEIDIEQPFMEMGLDSIVGVEWVHQVNRSHGIGINAIQVYDYPNIVSFARLVESLTQADGAAAAAEAAVVEAAVPTVPAVPVAAIEAGAPLASIEPRAVAAAPVGNEPMRREALRRQVIESLAAALYMEPEEIDVGQPFVEMGLDSIIGVEWIHGLNRRHGTSIQAIQVYDHPDVEALTDLLLRSIPAPADDPAPRAVVAAEVVVAAREDRADPPTAEACVAPASLLDELIESLAQALFVPASTIDAGPGLALGELDAVVAEEWLSRVNRRHGVRLRVDEALACARLTDLAALIETRRAAPQAPRASQASQASQAPQSQPLPNDADPAAGQAASTRAHAAGGEPIAIIGMSGRYPGARDLDAYWDNLAAGRSSIVEIPASRWDLARHFDADPARPGKSYSKWIGLLDDADCFDPAFFRISPAEAQEMDPQHRLFLQEGYRAFESAGYSADTLDGRNCGVYLGIMSQDYRQLGVGGAVTMLEKSNSFAIGAARLAYHLNLKGPAIPVDTACSSALVAIHLACQALRAGEIDMALAGGVTLYLSPDSYLEMCSSGMLSADGRCKTFDDAANGFVPGEGVGAVVLRRLADAQRDGDPILATVIGSGINQDGKTNGITAPNMASQLELVAGVHARHGIDAETIGYVEAHGTGTRLGDPIELTALTEAFRRQTSRTGFCALGSVKSNIGHTSAAAGVAGLHKVLLSLRHATLVPSLHFEVPNRHFDFSASPFQVNTACRHWTPAAAAPRRAAVSSFGFSGTNAHLVIEEYAPAARSAGMAGPYLIPLSARNRERLLAYAAELRDCVARLADLDQVLADLAYTFQVGRQPMAERVGLLARDKGELLVLLDALLAGREHAGLVPGRRERDGSSDTVAPEQLRAWLEAGEPRRILESWAAGATLDWQGLYLGCPAAALPRRMAAPAYPFAPERHWLPAKTTATADDAGSGTLPPARAHALLGDAVPMLSGMRFDTVLHGDESFLRDHRIGGRPVLPSTAYLEMVREASARALGESADSMLVIEAVNWVQPLTAGDGARRLRLVLRAGQDAQSLGFEAGSTPLDDEAGPVMHCTGTARRVPRVAEADAERRAREACLATLADPADVFAAQAASAACATLHARFARLGIDYGDSHRLLRRLHRDGDTLLAELAAPPGDPASSSYGLHPAVLDAALQPLLSLLDDEFGEDTPVVPYRIDRVEFHAATGGAMRACLRRRRPVEADGGEAVGGARFDVELCDARGALCVALRGVAVAAWQHRDEAVRLEPVWHAAPLDAGERSAAGVARRLVWWLDEAAATAAAGRARQAVEVVQSGAATHHATAARAASLSADDPAALPAWFEAHALALFEQLRERMASTERQATLVQIVVPTHGPGAMLAALGALLDTAYLENPLLRGQVIAFDALDTLDAAALDAVLEREACHPADTRVRYLNGERQVASLAATHASRGGEARPLPWRQGGVYLITGAGGGLARALAERIADRLAGAAPCATLVLTGRSAAGGEVLAAIERIRAQGVAAEYRVLDVTDRAAVERMVAAIVDEFGALHGVMHCAGLLRDGYLLRKRAGEFEQVLAPKVRGAVNLDLATRGLASLDCFVLFSSGAGVVGNPGQGDYAVANAFMDAFAAHRAALGAARAGLSLSIAWPIWQTGGMRIDRQTEAELERRLAMRPMPSAVGLDTLEACLGGASASPMVVYGAPARIQALARQRFAVPEASRAMGAPAVADSQGGADAAQDDGGPDAAARSVAVHAAVRAAIDGALATVLKLPESRLREAEHFESYGIDSINAIRLIAELERSFGPLPKTLFFEYQFADELERHLVAAHGATIAARLCAESAAAGSTQASSGGPFAESSEATEATEAAAAGGATTPRPASPACVWPAQGADECDIAVIGMAGKYPQADDLEQYWDNLRAGRDCIEEVPAHRWDWRRYYDPARGRGSHHSKWGGFLSDADAFDPLFFNISPKEATSMDPKERLFLEQVWTAMEDAGLRPEDLRHGAGRGTGVYVGLMYENYQLLAAEAAAAGGDVGMAGGSYASIANRVSFFFDLHGPSLAIDTMCSSSMVAVHLACRDLLAGEIGIAIAGGVNLSLHPNKYRMLSAARFMSADGRCASFGSGGEGYVPGEGVGALLLKRRADAERDGDRILGLVKASAINHGGRSNGYTVPNAAAQGSVISRAIRAAGVDARAINYVEAHGTGTALGDPIELAGLARGFAGSVAGQAHGLPGEPCRIGSVKSNIGHCEGAAGVAALTKVLLQLRHGELVPSLHSHELNPDLPLAGTRWVVNQSLCDWPRVVVDGVALPRTAGVSSFGAGGTNAHVIVSEYPESDAAEPEAAPGEPAGVPVVVPLSARNAERLAAYAERLHAFVVAPRRGQAGPPRLADLACTFQRGRIEMPERLAIVAHSLADLEQALAAFVAGARTGHGIHAGRADAALREATPRTAAPAASGPADAEEANRLAARWVAGEPVDWPSWATGPSARRISAPTYPFARGRYWVGARAGAGANAGVDATAGRKTGAVRLAAVAAAAVVPHAASVARASSESEGTVKQAEHTTPRAPRISLTPLSEFNTTSTAPASAPTPALVAASAERLAPASASTSASTSAREAATQASLLAELRGSLAGALFVGIEELDIRRPFAELGLDSIVGVEWIREVKQRYGVAIRSTDVYEYPSLAEFAGLLERLLRESARQPAAGQLAGAVPELPAAAAVEAMPDTARAPRDAARLERIVRELARSLADALFVELAEIDAERPFVQIGMDSIVGVEWIKGINQRYGVALKAMDVYDHPNVTSIARLVEAQLDADSPTRDATAAVAAPVVEPAVAAAAPSVASPIAPSVEPAAVAAGPTSTSTSTSPASSVPERIAIVGMSGRYPGAPDLDTFWDKLAAGHDAITEVPPSRWPTEAFYDPEPGREGKVYCKWIGLLDDVDRFDPDFFRISPAEAEEMDPQHRLFLQEGYRAIERMGCAPGSLSRQRCGVYLGVMNHEYGELAMRHRGAASGIGSSYAIGAARLAYYLNLKGPAIPVDTACSSALVATHLACQALRNGEIDLALVGGVTVYLTPESYIAMCAAGMLSPEGRCKTFDDAADGFVPGEGVGALVLKRLADAERDGDPILGVIVGSGLNQDGRTNGITAPSGSSQTELLREVYRRHAIDPGSIGYVEAHGTGTRLGDPIELTALSTAFGDYTDRRGFCALGSVKSNIGHTSAAAGVASLQKVLLCLAHGELVPTLNYATPNRHFDFDASPFYVNTDRRDWPAQGDAPRRAAVSSFGFSGTNAHVVIEEYRPAAALAPRPAEASTGGAARRVLVPLSARHPERLRDYARSLADWLAAPLASGMPARRIDDLARTMQLGRDAMAERVAFVAGSREELERQLRHYARTGEPIEGVHAGRAAPDSLASGVLALDEEFGAAIEGWLRKGKHEQLAKLWAGGLDLDWARLYDQDSPATLPRRIAAPTYPFASERYWIDVAPVPAPHGGAVDAADAPDAPDAPDAAAPADDATLAYLPVWEEIATPAAGTPQARAGSVLIVHRGASWGLVEALERDAGAACLRLDLSGPRAAPDGRVWRDGAPDAARLADWLAAFSPVRALYFVAGCSEARHDASSASGWLDTGAAGPAAGHAPGDDERALLQVAQALMRTQPADAAIDCVILALDHHRRDGTPSNPVGGGVAGIAYSLAQGDHRLRVTHVDVSLADLCAPRDAAAPHPVLDAVSRLAPSDRGALVRLQAGRAYRQAFVRLQTAGEPAAAGLKQGGVYLILGGAGHVGRVLTRQLAERYRASVIWIGRSAPESARVAEARAALGSLGAGPDYLQADVTDAAQMRAAIASIRRRHGRIDGAVFCGMVFDADHGIARLPVQRLDEILEVKASGSRVFHEVLADQPLDFLCYCSSAQSFSFSGAARLGAYAAATTAGDAWVRSIASTARFPVGTIHWGFWETSLADSALGSRHLAALSDQQGFACFEYFVSQCTRGNPLRELVCMRATPEVERLMPVLPGELARLAESAAAPTRAAPGAADAVARGAGAALVPPPGAAVASAQIETWLARLAYATLGPLLAAPRANQPWRERWWDETLRRFAALGWIRLVDGVPKVLVEADALDALWRDWAGWRANLPPGLGRRAQLELAEACLRALPEVLAGRLPAAELLFPGGSMARVEGVYRDNPVADYFNAVQGAALLDYLRDRLDGAAGERGEPIRLLEVGGGTGGTTAVLLALLRPHAAAIGEYHFSDLSQAFLQHAQARFGAQAPYLRTGLLDIERPLEAQSLPLGRYDVLIATNVLHATRGVREAVRNAKACLRAGGLLLINEIVEPSWFTHLSFGLLEGWWLHQDAALREPGSPVLAAASWCRLLAEEGFEAIELPARDAHALGQQVMAARSDGVIRQRVEAPAREQGGAHPDADRIAPATDEAGGRPAPRGTAGAGDAASTRAEVVAAIHHALKQSLKLSEARIVDQVPFLDYGIDSILGVRFIDSLKQALDLPLNTAVLFEYPTVERLAGFIVATHGGRLLARAAAPAAASMPPDASAAAASALEPAPASRSSSASTPASISAATSASTAASASVSALASVSTSASSSDIAVIGMAGQFPEAPDVAAFAALLARGHDGMAAATNGMLEARDDFDHDFFRLGAEEAEAMHPYQRLVLQESWKALEDAGYNPVELAGKRVGVFVGAEPVDYRSPTFSGASDALIASRVSYHLNLRGPAYVINTGCSSSAVAIHLACESLRRGESDLVLACGIFAAMGPRMLGTLGQAGMLSAGGRCRSFEADADGTAFSESVGIVVLKRLDQALADGDPLHGIVKASGVNQDGTSNGIMAPNGVAQEELMVDVYQRFAIDPADIDYVEAHGTGTLFGDAVEANALVRAFRRFTDRTGYCTLGTVKTTIGHGAAAAGVVALIRVLLAMRDARLPGMPRPARANPMIDLDASPFRLGEPAREWRDGAGGRPRLAAINSFGHSGTNVHLVVQAAPAPMPGRPHAVAHTPHAVPLSAMDDAALRRQAARLAAWLAAAPTPPDLLDLAHTLRVARESMARRVVLCAASTAELLDRLRDFAASGAGVEPGAAPGRLEGAVSEAQARAAGLDAAQAGCAARWLAGETLAWPALDAARRVHLPTYPFAGRRCATVAGWERSLPARATASDHSAGAGDAQATEAAAVVPPAAAAAAPMPEAGPAAWLAARIAGRLGLPAERVDRRRSLLDLGLSSLDLVSLAGQLREATGEALLPSVLFDYPSIERLAAYLSVTCPAAFVAPSVAGLEGAPAASAVSSGAVPEDVADGPAPDVMALLERLEGGALSLEETIFLIENTK